MTTVNLKLSRQLQELWPEWNRTYFNWYEDSWGNWKVSSYTRVSRNPSRLPAYSLDELRVFALELIGPEPEKHKHKRVHDCDITCAWGNWWGNRYALKEALIQGCDPTAEWIINTFGGK